MPNQVFYSVYQICLSVSKAENMTLTIREKQIVCCASREALEKLAATTGKILFHSRGKIFCVVGIEGSILENPVMQAGSLYFFTLCAQRAAAERDTRSA
jgi:hypothetical protein